MGPWRSVLLSMIGLFPVLMLSPVDGFPQGMDLPGVTPYREHGASCHGRDPAALARRTLKRDGSRVMLDRSGAPLDGFLQVHRRAGGSERQDLIDVVQFSVSSTLMT